MFKLLFGFDKPSAGKILLGGQDITRFDENSMRELCAFVPQKPYILPGTFKSNIACRCPNATDEEVATLMEKLGLTPKFSPQQNIIFGFDGPKLSGGERQRVIIARALLEMQKKPIRYLYFDEGLVSLDQESEGVILTALREATQTHHVTTIIITHDLARLEKIVKVDLVLDIVRLRKGEKNYLDMAHRATGPQAALGTISDHPSTMFDDKLKNKEGYVVVNLEAIEPNKGGSDGLPRPTL